MVNENEIVQKYIDDISHIITYEQIIPDEQFSLPQTADKTQYMQVRDMAITFIKSKLNAMFHIKALTLALFIIRNECKKRIYDFPNAMKEWSLRYVIINKFFMFSYFQSHGPVQITCNDSDLLAIKSILAAIVAIINNQQIFDASFYDSEAIERFMTTISDISNLKYDLHSYCISNLSVQHCLKYENLSSDIIKSEAIQALPTVYISDKELTKNSAWINILNKYSLTEPAGILRIPIIEFNLLDSRIRDYLLAFDTDKCKNPLDPESELIFTYCHGMDYYIAISVMPITQEQIEKFSMWGQYSKVLNYYFNQNANQRIANKYNRLLTYRIVDLLLNNDYVIPSERKHNFSVPMIELKHYTSDKKKCGSLGDIDLSFYSPFTNTVYLIEFKNYQMIVNLSNNFSYDLEKASRDNVDERVLEREDYISANIEDFFSIIYKKVYPNCAIRSIILTTKPCFYFFLNPPTNYDYYDWIQFKKRIENNEL